jgi:hypothetical protein
VTILEEAALVQDMNGAQNGFEGDGPLLSINFLDDLSDTELATAEKNQIGQSHGQNHLIVGIFSFEDDA